MDFLIYIAILPVILLLGYIYKKDIDKEPRGILTRLFIFGGLSVIPIAIAELVLGEYVPGSYLPTFLGTFLNTFVSIGIVEELGKWFIVYLCAYRRREYNHAYDGIVYAVFASLGFACVENILYVVQSGFGTGIMRALLAVPGHAVDAVFMGFFLSMSKDNLVKKNNGKSLLYLLLSLLIPATVHTIYDGLIFHYLSSESSNIIVIFFGFVIVSYIVSVLLINRQAKIQYNFDGSLCVDTNKSQETLQKVVIPQRITPQVAPVKQNNYCHSCGGVIVNNKCSNCGFTQI